MGRFPITIWIYFLISAAFNVYSQSISFDKLERAVDSTSLHLMLEDVRKNLDLVNTNQLKAKSTVFYSDLVNLRHEKHKYYVALFLSRYYRKRLLTDEAIIFIDQAVESSKKLKDKTMLANLILERATYQSDVNQEGALDSYEDAIRLFSQLKDSDRLAITYYEYSVLLFRNADFEGCLEKSKVADSIMASLGERGTANLSHEIKILWTSNRNTQGLALTTMKKYDDALKSFEDALVLAKKFDFPLWVGLITGNMGDTYLKSGDTAKARECMMIDIQLSKDTRNFGSASGAAYVLGKIALAENNLETAQSYFDSALLWNEGARTKILSSVYLRKAELYERKKDYKNAITYFKQGTALNDSLISLVKRVELTQYQNRLTLESKQREIDILNLNAQLSERNIQLRNILILVAVICFFMASAFALMFYKNVQSKNLDNLKLQRKNDEIILKKQEIEIQKSLIEEQKEELTVLIEEREREREKLVHSEKMISLGQLTAGIAHELNNPANFISGGIINLQFQIEQLQKHFNLISGISDSNKHVISKSINTKEYKETLSGIWEEIGLLSKAILSGAERTVKIVSGLKTFSYDGVEKLQHADIVESLEGSLTILQNEIRDRIEIKRDYKKVPNVHCNLSEISQVFVNVLMNAVQSIQDKGTISILVCYLENEQVVSITITDTGIGIPKKYMQRIYEPFFTSKPIGKGTGLGLSISHKIIEKHNGKILVESKEGEGTKVMIHLPVHS